MTRLATARNHAARLRTKHGKRSMGANDAVLREGKRRSERPGAGPPSPYRPAANGPARPSSLGGEPASLGGELRLPTPPADSFSQPFPGAKGAPQNLGIPFEAGYRNEYGTNVGVYGNPVERSLGVRGNIPIGDHQRGMYVGGEAEWSPDRGASAFVSVGKRNVPEPPSVEEIVRGMDPETAALVRGNPGLTRALQRRSVDQRMGIGIPGTNKYEFSAGINQGQSGTSGRYMPGAGFPGMEPNDFGRDFEPYPGQEVIPANYRPRRR